MAKTAKCIDISCWQKGIDFKKVKAAGIEAVIIRAGYGREASQKDTQFEAHYKGAKAAGLKIGAYWYSYAESVADAKKEAQTCLACVLGKNFDLPIYFDMEESWQTGLGKKTLTAMNASFNDTIKASGYRAGTYSNLNWFSNYLDYNSIKSKYSVWLAQWSSSHTLSCDIWQYSESGNVNGITGNVDMNIIENIAVITASAGGTTKTTTATKTTGITETQLRQKVANQALAWLGAVEGDRTHAEIINIYNSQSSLPEGWAMGIHAAWCATFVSAVWLKVGIAKYTGTHCNCGYFKDIAIKKGTWVENDAYVPKVGDAIIYYWSDTGKGDCNWGADHIGIVVAVSGNTFTVVEGNMGSGYVGKRNMHVDGQYIRGFIAPDYAAIAKAVAGSITPDNSSATSGNSSNTSGTTKEMTTVLNVNYLGKTGYTNNSKQVKTVQILLNAAGFKGKDGKTLTVDGAFGVNTEYAVKAFQKKNNASADGVVGPVTWKLLTGAK